MDEVLGSAQAIKEMARIIHSFLKAKFPSLTMGERDDIEQEVKLKLLRMGAGGKKIGYIKSYLYRAVYTTALDSLDRRWDQLGPEAASAESAVEAAFPSDNLGPEVLLERSETSQALRRAVEGLPRRRRAVLELHLLGMDIPESAAFLSWSQPAVRHLLYRGMADLKKAMGDNGGSKGG